MYVCLKSHVGKSRQILITLVEKDSPAEGKLEVGDVILGVFGKLFADDARRVFGQAETEKADVKLPMIVWRKGESQTLELKLQVMGTYSETSPYDCPKSKKILDQELPLVVKNFAKENSLHVNEFALLASGRPEYLDVVRKSAQEVTSKAPDVETLWKNSSDGGMATWHHGYNNIFLCEYFLATGDKTVLPAIRSYTTTISRGQDHFGPWGHGYVPPTSTGELHGPVPPYGPVNMTGLPCFVSLPFYPSMMSKCSHHTSSRA